MAMVVTQLQNDQALQGREVLHEACPAGYGATIVTGPVDRLKWMWGRICSRAKKFYICKFNRV